MCKRSKFLFEIEKQPNAYRTLLCQPVYDACISRVRDFSFYQRLFRSPKYYARRATELLRQQNLEASVQVHGQEEEGQQEEEEEEEELHELIFVTKKDGEKQETAGNYVVGGDSSREEDFENEEPKDDPLLATIGFDSDFFNALSMFGREDLRKNDDEENISSGKKQSSYVQNSKRSIS